MGEGQTSGTTDSGGTTGEHPAEPAAGGGAAGARDHQGDLAPDLEQPTAGGDVVHDAAFWRGLIRVRLRGEEAVARRVAVVTEEVVVRKTITTERRWISAAVRKELVETTEGPTEGGEP
jgi:hypothetical protein